jgi:hypothetical protein
VRFPIYTSLLALLLSTGCKDEKKTDSGGPRITGGTPIDPKVGPEKPAVGGQIKPGQ